MKNKCLLLSTFSTFQTPLTLLTNCALVEKLAMLLCEHFWIQSAPPCFSLLNFWTKLLLTATKLFLVYLNQGRIKSDFLLTNKLTGVGAGDVEYRIHTFSHNTVTLMVEVYIWICSLDSFSWSERWRSGDLRGSYLFKRPHELFESLIQRVQIHID